MAIIVRAVQTRDLVVVREQLVETWHATYDPIFGAEKVREITTRWHSLANLAAQLNAPESAFFLAEEQGVTLGSSYAQMKDGAAKLYRLYIRPTAQNRGIGRQLLQRTFASLPHSTTQTLEVEPRNQAAIRFYERQGFRCMGEILSPDPGGNVDALIYERTAPPQT